VAATLPLSQISRLLGQQTVLILTHREIQLAPEIHSFVGTGLLDSALHSGKDRLSFNYRFEGLVLQSRHLCSIAKPMADLGLAITDTIHVFDEHLRIAAFKATKRKLGDSG
jgi:hypothetical protein